MKIVGLEKQRLISKMVLKTDINAYLKDKAKEKMLQFFNLHLYAKNHLNVKLRHNKKFSEYYILLSNTEIATIYC